MRLNASLAVAGLTHHEWEAEDVIHRIRHLLCDLDADVHVELLAVGNDFGEGDQVTLLAQAEATRRDLLRCYWRSGQRYYLHQSLRLGHSIASLNLVRIRQILADFEQ